MQVLGPASIACFTQIFNHCIQGVQEWPHAFQWARIVLPGKVADPCQIRDGRPINILALLYRLAMKSIAREVLMHLSFRLPPSIVGGLPGRDGSLLWYHSQFLIEKTLAEDGELHGAVTDLQKFFNGIPRSALAKLMISFGIPGFFAHSWMNLLNCLKRSVIVAGDYSFPQTSTCGVPEGDPLSVIAAVLLGAQYIDNIEIIATSEQDLHDATQIAMEFFHQWGFLIDQDKSWTWSTVPTKDLHHAPIFKPARSAKNLGCFVRYKKSTHHGDLGTRIQEGTRRAAVLAALPYEQEGRMSAIQAGPYASAFYGSEVHYVGHKPLVTLRKNVANIIAKPHKGLNRQVALLSYKSGRCDPRVVLILRACKLARRAVGKFPDRFRDFWHHVMVEHGDVRKTYGPARALGAYLHSVGIVPIEDMQIRTPAGKTLHFFQSCPLELEQAVLLGWEARTTDQIRKRKGLDLLPELDLEDTHRALANIPDLDARLVRTYLAGGICTNEKASHWTDTNGTCAACGAQDTLAQACSVRLDPSSPTRFPHSAHLDQHPGKFSVGN